MGMLQNVVNAATGEILDHGDFVTAFGPKLKIGTDASAARAKTVVKQSFKEECDINRIMAKYQKTGVVSWLSKHEGRYADVTGFDFMESMNTIAKANEMFADLPSKVRGRFANDPVRFLEFMHDPESVDESYKLGLRTRPQPAPDAVPPVKPEEGKPAVASADKAKS